MSKPQQPELHRSGHGNSDPSAVKASMNMRSARRGSHNMHGMGHMPIDNQPGHHPLREQDKPDTRRLRRH